MVAGSSGAGMALVTEGYRNLIGRDVRFRPLDPEPKAMAIWAWWRRGDVATWRCQPRDVSPAMSAPRYQPASKLLRTKQLSNHMFRSSWHFITSHSVMLTQGS